MIKSLDPTIQQVTPVDDLPVQPPGYTAPTQPESGSPQVGPLVTTGTPAANGNTGIVPPNFPLPQPGVGSQGFGGLVGTDFMRQVTPNELTSEQLARLTAANSPYMQNAARRGVEYANSRGNLNSSIGAGASQRASLEAGLPIAQSDAQVYRDANSQNADALNNIRQAGVNSMLGQNDALFNAQAQDWLANNQFNRQFNGQLAMLPIANAADMWSGLMQLAATNPQVFTPTVLAGYQDFFQQGFNNYIGQYLSGSGGGP